MRVTKPRHDHRVVYAGERPQPLALHEDEVESDAVVRYEGLAHLNELGQDRTDNHPRKAWILRAGSYGDVAMAVIGTEGDAYNLSRVRIYSGFPVALPRLEIEIYLVKACQIPEV